MREKNGGKFEGGVVVWGKKNFPREEERDAYMNSLLNQKLGKRMEKNR